MENFRNSLTRIVGIFQTNRFMQAITNAMMAMMPIMMIGSFATLIMAIDVGGYQAFLASSGLLSVFNAIYNVTMNLMAIYVAFLVGYKLSEQYEVDALTVGMISLMAFFILVPFAATDKGKDALAVSSFGAGGLFTAMVAGLISARIAIFCMQKNFTIKMPKSVPPIVSKSFSALIPAAVTALIFGLIRLGFSFTSFGDATTAIYAVIQTPLQNMGNNIFTALLLVVLMEGLWFLGIHGSLVVYPILLAVFQPMDLANMQALNTGTSAFALPYIITAGFIMGQKGPRTLALALILSFKTKSEQLKKVGRIGLVPACFGISEPLKFGVPMVMNPIILVPMVLTPVASILISYFAISIGFMPHLNGVSVGTGVPEIIKGLFTAGWQGVVVQIICLAACLAIYYPFIKYLDKQKCKEELERLENTDGVEE